ncbi:MAG: sugar phosphate nucleotidyltransferase, partial [SAR202 cluster bacterium]|nr:sugar phosphate nucleotidyltransferase [SAR202 cluster bacterium]
MIITAAGKGTRLLPFTKEIPKEMMPIFSKTYTKQKTVLPLLQYIFEQLYSMNFRDYCFVVGREKRSIEDHFTPHETYLKDLVGNYKESMKKFYQKLENSHLVWINQNKPLGFGDAVKRTERYVGKEDFIVHAGDVTILSKNKHPILR